MLTTLGEVHVGSGCTPLGLVLDHELHLVGRDETWREVKSWEVFSELDLDSILNPAQNFEG